MSRDIWLVFLLALSSILLSSAKMERRDVNSSNVEIFANKLLDCTRPTLREAIYDQVDNRVVCKVGRIFAAVAYQCHIPHVAEAVFAIYESIEAHSRSSKHSGRKKTGGDYVMLSALEYVPSDHPVGWIEDLMKLITPSSMTLLNPHFPTQKDSFPSLCQAMLKNAGCMTPLISFKSLVINKKPWFPNKKTALNLRVKLGMPAEQHEEGEVCILKRKNRSLSNMHSIALAQNATAIEFSGSMSLSQQAQLMSRCRIVFSVHGAQLTNVAWMKLSGAVIEFLPWGTQIIGYYFKDLYDSLELKSIQIHLPREDSNLDQLPCFQKFVHMTAEQCAKESKCFGCAKTADYVASALTLEKINKEVAQLLVK